MNISVSSVFARLPGVHDGTYFEQTLLETSQYTVTRIIACNISERNHAPVSFDRDGFMLCLQGYVIIRLEKQTFELHYGDTLHIPAHTKLQLIASSSNPYCIMLLISMNNTKL